mgnify:CR=1 FL=1
MGAAGNKKPKGMHKKHAPAYQVEEAIHENDLKKGKKKYGTGGVGGGFHERICRKTGVQAVRWTETESSDRQRAGESSGDSFCG